jgi:hypothetical protein
VAANENCRTSKGNRNAELSRNFCVKHGCLLTSMAEGYSHTATISRNLPYQILTKYAYV